MPDLLGNLWLQAINIDPAGMWMARAWQVPPGLDKYYANCAPALERLRQLGTTEDIGRVARFIRFEACSELLYSINDPGVRAETSFHPAPLIEAALSGKSPSRDLGEFVQSLRETLAVDDDGVWLSVMTFQEGMNETFKEIADAVHRLLEAGASVADLAQLAIWSSYEACESTLRLLHESALAEPDEITGLFESLPGADPSGKEGGAGSWPLSSPHGII